MRPCVARAVALAPMAPVAWQCRSRSVLAVSQAASKADAPGPRQDECLPDTGAHLHETAAGEEGPRPPGRQPSQCSFVDLRGSLNPEPVCPGTRQTPCPMTWLLRSQVAKT